MLRTSVLKPSTSANQTGMPYQMTNPSFSVDRPMPIEERVGQSHPQVSCEEGQETPAAKDAPSASTSGITPASKQSS
ncbi:hypothetical protein RRG08_035396 [Elysia crispata]|uniref:Uncharacterized protein n=1 Tax=Elysia crispata TaxID=231223 RepID=A0AAE0Y3Z2_9GAST|nr:hypothetical protein RRG08_035396 [Elysia crispata]